MSSKTNQPPNSFSSKEELEALLLEGLKNPLPSSAITKEFWDELRRKAEESIGGKDIHP